MDPQTVRMAATSSGATSPAPMAWRLPWTSNITFDMCATNFMRYYEHGINHSFADNVMESQTALTAGMRTTVNIRRLC